jgi:polysaccharide biosynthesis protein PslH
LREIGRHCGGSRAISPRDRAGGACSRVLFVSCHLPAPPISGGRRRELELIKRLSTRFEVHLVVVSKTPELDLAHARDLDPYCTEVEVFKAAINPPGWADHDEPEQVRRHRCPEATGRIGELLAHEQVDLVHVEGYYLMQHVPGWTTTPVLLVEQNVEYELERQRKLMHAAEPALRALAACARTRAAETKAWRRATLLGAVTEEDRETMRRAAPGADVRVIPDGADHLPHVRSMTGEDRLARPRVPLVTLLANFAYGPNVDAAQHLCRDILPRLRRYVPGVHVWLVGNDPPAAVRELESPTVRVTGRVPDVVPYLDAADVVVCPLRIGGGIKVKAIEALRRGKAIVTTPIGAQGLPPQARAAMRVAARADHFAEHTAVLLLDRAQRTELERRAHQAATQMPTWDQAATALGQVYDELLVRTEASAHPVLAGGPA